MCMILMNDENRNNIESEGGHSVRKLCNMYE